ncbi:unnamed protein product [Rotaria sp. Silwood1]|nr:unnamed protein product [Rotaria sp. Silwood1]
MFNDISTLLQVFLLCFTSLLIHIVTSNPNVISTNDYVPYEGISLSFVSRIAPKIGKLLIWTSTLYQTLYLLLRMFSPTSISIFFPQISTSLDLLQFNPMSMIGYILIIVGGLGRIWCYRTLGAFFTFEVTIRSTHKLIKTGPYAYVRHPSYTFVCILICGILLIHQRLTDFFPNQTWLKVMYSPIGILMFHLFVMVIVARRVKFEEEELAKKFGSEWTQYALKRKRYIPKII